MQIQHPQYFLEMITTPPKISSKFLFADLIYEQPCWNSPQKAHWNLLDKKPIYCKQVTWKVSLKNSQITNQRNISVQNPVSKQR